MRRRLSIGTVLLAINLAALILPLSGLWVLRLYESALIRQTESELIAQAGVVAAFYRSAWREAGGRPEQLGAPVDPQWTRRSGFELPWLPRFAVLDLADDQVLPAAADPGPVVIASDAAASRAGARIAPILRDAQRVTLAGMRMLDHRGVVVASTGEELTGSMAEQEEVSRALVGEPVSVLRKRTSRHSQPRNLGLLERSRELRVHVAQPVLDSDRVAGVVLLSRTPRTIADALRGKRPHLIGLAVLALTLVAVLVAMGIVAISRPLRAVTAQAKRAADGERGAMMPLARPIVREVAELSEALARMTATLEQRADYIRDFAAHVSHEFKTPLTTLRGTIELLRDHLDTMSHEERERFLANMDAETERLSRLVRRLLELARADVAVVAGGDAVDAVPVAMRLASRFGATCDCPAAMTVVMAADALEACLANLLDNARRHAGADAAVRIVLRLDGEWAVIGVSDDGPGVSAANSHRIFTPFFTTARQSGGTGLGLAIVHSIVAAYGGSVALMPSEEGAAFEMRLRRALPG